MAGRRRGFFFARINLSKDNRGMKMNNISAYYDSKLSQRSVEILKLLIMGYTNEEIGKKLFISPHTVKAYMEHLLDIFDVKNRTALAAIAARYLPADFPNSDRHKMLLNIE